ncbi:MAG TPA: hypothetical protein VL595_02175 [Pseudonocardia sp.]|nr:hypothetical protein [Pseudonocardia sp.]
MTEDEAPGRGAGQHRPGGGAAFLFGALVVSAVAMVCAGIWVGDALTGGLGRTELGWRNTGYPAVAVVSDATPVAPSPGGDVPSASRRVSVRWTAPDGSARTGDVSLPTPVEAGAHVPVTVGADGVPHAEPAVSARTVGLAAGVTGALVGWSAIWALGMAVRDLLLRRSRDRWDRRWRAVEPDWSGRPEAPSERATVPDLPVPVIEDERDGS